LVPPPRGVFPFKKKKGCARGGARGGGGGWALLELTVA